MPNTSEKTSKDKPLKIHLNSGSDSDESEHELSYYMKDKVKLMKEVLKLIKPKKIKLMAPDCIKHLDIVEINSMLLEELLGISNKRLHYIFNGENVDRESSSSDPDEEKPPIDVISLDDISDDDIELCINKTEKDDQLGKSKKQKRHKSRQIKMETTSMAKTQKVNDNASTVDTLKESEREKLMSVLELLELQARARAIKSQLALETSTKPVIDVELKVEDDSDPDAVIIESPKHKEIVLSSSESDDDCCITEVTQTTSNPVDKDITLSPPRENSNTIDASVLSLELDRDIVLKSAKILEMKKQKLLSKVKKIKLNKNKILTSDITNKCIEKENSTEANNDTNPQNQLEASHMELTISECSNIPKISSGNIEDETSDNVTNKTTIKSNEAEINDEINSNTGAQNFALNEMDCSETVVINLDNDERQGLEIDCNTIDTNISLDDVPLPDNSKKLDANKQLLSKVKKVKLNKNKIFSSDKENSIKENNDANLQDKQDLSRQELTNTECSNVTKISSANIEDEATGGNLANKTEIESNDEINSNGSAKNLTLNEIDCSETVVINLDEDEMEGIEND